MKRVITVNVAVVVLASLLLGAAQDVKKSPEAPKLKADVALAIKDTQLQMSNLQLQYSQLVQQYTNKLQGQLATALKDSGIDESKYQLDPTTLNVTEKPKAADKAK